MSKTHLLADESLGGVLREYIEVERKADVGDYVVNCKDTEYEGYFKVTGYSREFESSYDVDYSGKENDDEYTVAVSVARSITLEPTDIVVIDGERYRLVERKAEVGEKVIIGEDGYFPEHIGLIGVVVFTYDDSASINVGDTFHYYPYVDHSAYRVLERLADDEPVEVDESQAHPNVIDMLANLAQRIVNLERNLELLKRADTRIADEIDTLTSNQRKLCEEFTNKFDAIKEALK